MSPLIPRGKRPWAVDPGHILDVPEPPPMPDEQERGAEPPASPPGTASPLEPIEVRQASEEAREPHGEPAPVPDPSEVDVPRALAQEIRRAMKRYPQKRSAAIPALWAVQRRYGWCTPEGIEQAAAVMGVTPAYLESVASFYDLFRLEPEGEHQVLVCTNISCWLRGADRLLEAFGEAAGVDGQGSSEDGKVFVRRFECLGACDLAPMASIDERYYGPLDADDAEAAVEQLRSRKEVLPQKRLQDRGAAGGKLGSGDKRLSNHPLNKGTRPKPRAKPKAKGKPKGKAKS
ncbi:MAG: NADH-quinone oxidoreductase subunit [Solirubrobacterales bacterium]|nr:NADH-quinone oxidoreductase subunit [Solirubrobacterales bacterium]